MDSAELNPDAAARKRSNDLIAFLTPIVKASHRRVDGSDQSRRAGPRRRRLHPRDRRGAVDARCTHHADYEGTNGIQALDLLGRKVFGTGGKSAQMMVAAHSRGDRRSSAIAGGGGLATDLGKRLEQWGRLTAELGMAAMKNPEEVGAAANDYLQFSGYVCLGWCWLASAGVAAKKLAEGTAEADFYKAKLATAKFYFDRILPRVDSHAAAARAGAAGLMSLPAEHFAFA
jgi:hypothetical protein